MPPQPFGGFGGPYGEHWVGTDVACGFRHFDGRVKHEGPLKVSGSRVR